VIANILRNTDTINDENWLVFDEATRKIKKFLWSTVYICFA